MAGLLDMVNDPRQAFLTNLGMGLLSAGGPSARPVSFGQAVGAAMPGAVQSSREATAYGEQQQMKALQLSELQRKQQEAARKLLAQQTFRGTLPTSEGAMFDVDPDAYFQALRDERKPMAVAPGGSVFQGGKSVFKAPEKPEIKEGYLIPDITAPGGWRADPELFKLHLQGKKAGASNISQSAGFKQESEEAKAIGGELGKQYSGLQSAALGSQSTLAKLNRAESLLSGLDTGALTPIGMKASALSESLGIQVDPKLPQKQAFEAIANELALRAKQQGETNLMPGAMSEADRNFLVAMAPNLAKTPGANKLLIETAKRMEKRNIELAKLARQYREKNKTFEGFAEYAQEYAERNPLFVDMQSKAPSAPKNIVVDW